MQQVVIEGNQLNLQNSPSQQSDCNQYPADLNPAPLSTNFIPSDTLGEDKDKEDKLIGEAAKDQNLD
jgi:hypothetical protein